MKQVLLINQHNLPLNIMQMDRALLMWTKGKADIVHEYENESFSVWGDEFGLPSVMRMRYFVNISKKRHLKDYYNKLNVWRRDKGECQYCGKRVKSQGFTVDHVMPKKRGGQTNWKNIVTACGPCNSKKDCRTPDEAGMRLLNTPKEPELVETIEMTIVNKYRRIRENSHFSWKEYIPK